MLIHNKKVINKKVINNNKIYIIMSIKDIDLDIENYSVNEIKRLFKLDDDYAQDDIQRNVDKLFYN